MNNSLFGTILVAFLLLQSKSGVSQQLESLEFDGEQRTYNLFVPSSWDSSQELPLLVVLHGLTQTGSGVMGITNFNSIAQENNFVACYPSGINNAWNANMNVSVSSADDLGFLEYLVNLLMDQYNLDPSRIYFCGFSNGGFMSMKMLCESSICIAGVASVSSTISDTVYNTCVNPQSSSILQIHGTADLVVPYNGSLSTGISVAQFLDFWSQVNGCNSLIETVDIPNINVFDFSTAQIYSYTSCVLNELKHVKVEGGGHQWPGLDTWNGGVGTINMDFNSPEFIWEFLKNKSCSSVGIQDEENFQFTIFPNPSENSVFLHSSEKFKTIEIYDLTGKVILIQDYNEFKNPIHLPTGTFFIELISESDMVHVKKIVVF